MVQLCHKDAATFVDTTHTEYGNKKVVQGQHDVDCTFLQNTGFLHTSNQDAIDADAILYPDHKNEFIVSSCNRLEGMYVVITPFGSPSSISWYKVTKVAVNRDHLRNNRIDNIQLLLKKTEELPGVS